MLNKINENPDIHESGIKKLEKKAKRLYKSLARNAALLRYATEIKSKKLQSIYRMWNCGKYVTIVNGKATSTYCGSKYCNNCSNMQAQERLKMYEKDLGTLTRPVFITLTVPNCKIDSLKATTSKMKKDFQKIYNRARGKGKPIKGIYKMEETINCKTKTYHPHIHLLIDGDINTRIKIYAECDEEERKQLKKVKNPTRGIERQTLPFIGNTKKYREGDRCELHLTNDIVSQWLTLNPQADIKGQKTKILLAYTQIHENANEKIKFQILEVLKYHIKPYETDLKEIAKTNYESGQKLIYQEFTETYIPMFLEMIETLDRQKQFATFGNFGKTTETEEIEENDEEEINLQNEIKGLDITDGTLIFNRGAYVHQETGEIIAEYTPNKSEYYKTELLLNKRTEEELNQIAKNAENMLNNNLTINRKLEIDDSNKLTEEFKKELYEIWKEHRNEI